MSQPGSGNPPEPTTMRITGLEDLSALEHTAASDHALTRSDEAIVSALRPRTALLVVLRGPNSGARFLLDDDTVSAGRHPDSDIFLDDVTVSRRHASFTRADGQFVVADVGSLNGTYVNRERIERPTALRSGDEVQIGKFRLVFLGARG